MYTDKKIDLLIKDNNITELSKALLFTSSSTSDYESDLKMCIKIIKSTTESTLLSSGAVALGYIAKYHEKLTEEAKTILWDLTKSNDPNVKKWAIKTHNQIKKQKL